MPRPNTSFSDHSSVRQSFREIAALHLKSMFSRLLALLVQAVLGALGAQHQPDGTAIAS